MTSQWQRLLSTGIFACCTLTFSLSSQAGITADAGVTSEFVRDGISQTRGKPAWQLGLLGTHSSGLYGGLWSSNVDRGKEDSVFAEVDAYAGFSLPIYGNWAVDTSLNRYTFHGDTDVDGEAYNEAVVRLLYNQGWMFGYRFGDNYFGSDKKFNSREIAYTFNLSEFSIEIYTANHRLQEPDAITNFGSANADDYWHFRVGVARTFNHWDYRLTAERTNLGSDYDAGTILQFSLHRYFNIW
ncbi:MAG: TorF family putative porin [Oleibacter sp.]|nr:TorF family putative porin [Thalassolituus sp.]